MLGFHPIASAPIASQTDVLVTVAGSMAASGGIAFTGTIIWGQFATIEAFGTITLSGTADVSIGTSIEATGGLTFGGSPVWSSLNALGTTGGITFGGHPRLRVAGRPIIISAVPGKYEVRADMAVFEITAVTDRYTVRGVA